MCDTRSEPSSARPMCSVSRVPCPSICAGCDLPKVTRGCPSSTPSSAANCARVSIAIAGSFPSAIVRRCIASRTSASLARKRWDLSSAPSGLRWPAVSISHTIITDFFSHAAARFGGRITCSAALAPSASEEKFGSLAGVDAALSPLLPAARGGDAASRFVPSPAAGSGFFRPRITATPTASECAQISPRLRLVGQVQVFSMSVRERTCSPARNSPSAPRTRPASSGGSYAASVTFPASYIARASFMASHPPASIRIFSVSCKKG